MSQKVLTIMTVLVLAGGVAEAQTDIRGLADKLPGVGKDAMEQAKELVDTAAEELPPMSETQAKHACGFDNRDDGELNAFQRTRAFAFQQGLQLVARQLDVDSLELPEKIQSPCYAEVRWNYVERRSSFWASRVATATNKALDALEIDYQIEAERLFADDANYEALSKSEAITLRKDIAEGLEMVERGIQEKEVQNAALMAEASAAMRSAVTYGAEIAGWDHRLLEFMADNGKWTWNRKERAITFKEHVELIGKTMKSLGTVTKAAGAVSEVGIDEADDVETERLFAENAAFEAALAEELDL